MAVFRSALRAAAAVFLSLASTGAFASTLAEARGALQTDYSQKLDALAVRCEQEHLDGLAQQLRDWLPKRLPATLYLFEPAQSIADQPAKGGAQLQVRTDDFYKLRCEQADNLFELARRASVEGQPSLAYELVAEAARENPDQAQARRLLGFVRFREGWYTPYEVRQLRAGKVHSPKFGWLPKSDVLRYEKGERQHNGRWISAADDARLHADIKNGWEVESEHYLVRTNHSLEQGVELADRLERFYRCWQQVFMPYVVGQKELARAFDGAAMRRDARRHKVVYFRTRDEYNRALVAAQPRIASTLGIYFDNTRTAYFFAGDDQDQGTLFHEATHQLFQETRVTSSETGRRSNFWIVEGVACYMETLKEHPGYWTLGGWEAGRMPAARERLLTDHFYVPLGELMSYGTEQIQHDARIARLYSQACGLTAFLVQYDGGRYREALVSYLAAVYVGRANVETLAGLARENYQELDRQYAEFCRSLKSASAE